ncbi:MAG: general secretion pathway protein GspB, partial [Burkholderiales bacterium]|nr:general secretion pathway protein GspB [Burkholderiales bacterium]
PPVARAAAPPPTPQPAPPPAATPRAAAPAAARPPQPAPAPPALPAPAPAPAPNPAPPARTPLLAELPEALRRELPPLAFGGAMDSPQPSSRMLIVNGQVLHEGDTVAPGLVLVTIRLRGALLDYKGTRFEVTY